jgi:hypothetical protein
VTLACLEESKRLYCKLHERGYSSSQAAITKCLNNRSLFSHRSWGWKPKNRALAWSVSAWSPLHDLQMATLLCPHMALVYAHRERKREKTWTLVCLLIGTLILLDQGPTFLTSFNLSYLPKACRSWKWSSADS